MLLKTKKIKDYASMYENCSSGNVGPCSKVEEEATMPQFKKKKLRRRNPDY